MKGLGIVDLSSLFSNIGSAASGIANVAAATQKPIVLNQPSVPKSNTPVATTKNNTWLYVGIGAGVLLAFGTTIYFVTKKKKSK